MYLSKSPILATLTLVTVIAGCANHASCNSPACMTAEQITHDVQARLDSMADFGAPGNIHVETHGKGVVTLSGGVDTGLERRLAESTAMKTMGVVTVVNNIDVVNK